MTPPAQEMLPRVTTRQETILRQALLATVDDAVESQRPVVLAAPAGYGKRTLLTQWADTASESGRRVRWVDYTHVADDPDLLTTESPTEDSTVIVEGTPKDQVRALLTKMRNPKGKLFPARLIVSTGSALGVLGRYEDEVLVIGEGDLAFKEEEVFLLAGRLGATEQTGNRIRQIREDVDGWPLGVRAALQEGGLASLAWGIHERAGDLLERELLGVLSGAVRVRPELLAQTLGATQDQSEAVLRRFVQQGHVTEGEDAVGRFFSLRPGLRPYLWELRSIPKSKCAQLRRAHALAGEILDPTETLHSLLILGDYAEAERVGAENFSEVLRTAERTLFALRSVSLQQLEGYPGLLLIRLVLERPEKAVPISTVERIAAHLSRAIAKELERRDPDSFLSYASMFAATERVLGRWNSALEISHELVDLMDGADLQESSRRHRVTAITYAVVALAGILGGDLPLALESSERGYELATIQNNPLEQVHALSLTALYWALLAETEMATEKLAAADRIEADADLFHPEFSWVDGQLARVFIAHDSGDMASATKALQPLLPAMDRMEQWPIVVGAEALVIQHELGVAGALARLENRLETRPPDREISPHWEAILGCRRAQLATWAGKYSHADRILSDLKAGGVFAGRDPAGMPVSAAASLLITEARLALYRGQPKQALKLCAERPSRTNRQERAKAEFLVIEGLAQYQLGDLEEAATTLDSLQELRHRADFDAIIGGVPYEPLKEAAKESGVRALYERLEKLPLTYRTAAYGVLTTTETEVLVALTRGLSMKDTADEMCISENTLKTHRRSIYQKLRVNSRAEALATARGIGLV